MSRLTHELQDLKPGECGVITELLDFPDKYKFLELGLIPGENLQLIRKDPSGWALIIKVGIRSPSYNLAIRREDAAKILVSKRTRTAPID